MDALWLETALLPGGWARDVRIAHADGAIVSVETGAAAAPGDERAAIGLPGVGNLHSHAFQHAMAGLAESGSGEGEESFWTWREVMYRFVETLTAEDVNAIASMAYAEMLECGFTRVGEFHYLHRPGDMEGAIVAAAQASGIGLTLLPVFYAHGGFGGAPADPRQAPFVHSRESFGRLAERCRAAIGSLPDGRLGIAPHSLRAVTPDELAAILPLAQSGPIHIHVAEQVREVDDCLAWSGARPVQWLLDHAEVDARWCLVHATHMDESETARLAASGAVAGLCPITEANLGDGLFPAKAYREAGGRFGVGSDSNVLIDLAEELRLLEYGQRLSHGARAVLGGGAALFAQALAGGAQALGVEAGLVAGAALDVVSLDGGHPALSGKGGDAILDGWIFAGAAVDAVWRRGIKVVSGGRHVRREAIAADYRRALRRILGR
jgi:formiminoglutamate deiminase